MSKANEPAFPTEVSIGDGGIIAPQIGENRWIDLGLTKREYAAIEIMAGICANSNPGSYQQNADDAVYATDLLFRALEK